MSKGNAYGADPENGLTKVLLKKVSCFKKEDIVFQPSIFSGDMSSLFLFFRGVYTNIKIILIQHL